MHQFEGYQIFIFDCDGVVLDSNELKINAMKDALLSLGIANDNVDTCTEFFSKNFGKSRFFHIEHFSKNILLLSKDEAEHFSRKLLDLYSSKCYQLYLNAELTPGFLSFINKLKGKKFIASGSEESELRAVFKKRGLDIHFDGIFGSPVKKSELVLSIIRTHLNQKAILFGDALSDLDAAKVNNIDFAAYLPFSNVKKELEDKAKKQNSLLLNDWRDIT